MTHSPELRFQNHIADFLARKHKFRALQQADIPDTEFPIVESELWAFLEATQAETLAKLAEDYTLDPRDEILRALRLALRRGPLWTLIRHGLQVRGLEIKLYYPKPRSGESVTQALYDKNRISFRPHFYFGENHKEIDFVLFLNGLPIVNLELKHEKNENVHHAVAQYAKRDHAHAIFRLPFLYIAADTSDVKLATDPRREENFRWFNTGLSNQPMNSGEYPVEFLYREELSRERLLEALAFFLVHVPEREADGDKPVRPASTVFPRYHQSRMVRKVADEALRHFADTGTIGRKFLIQHSAGSGKTLSICWLADRLHSLYKPGTADKLVDMLVILTDRKSLDKNIRDDIVNFTHLKDVVGLARRSALLHRFLRERKPIIVSTQQKFAWILKKIENDPALKALRVAFLIDEAHRSQEGRLGLAIRQPFRTTTEPGADPGEEERDAEDELAKIIRAHDHNQLFVAFTATPAPATLSLFGEPFDTYTEAEAIDEGYILDVASSILSYETLYHLHCPLLPTPEEEEKFFPKAVVAKALKNLAFQDDELIQYKAEVMLRLFEERVKPLIGGRAKAMIVATSRAAGLRYFQILKEKLREREADYQVLYAFSDFTLPTTNEAITEHQVNGLASGELIEDRFEGGDYRLMVVANKFQTGFDQPLLAGMFLDKAVADRNAVQTVSRLNRCHAGKQEVIVVDFTNNARAILKAFAKYRKGTPYEPGEPDQEECLRLFQEILSVGLFDQDDARSLLALIEAENDPDAQAMVKTLRERFNGRFAETEPRKAFVHLLARFVRSFYFLSCFFNYEKEVQEFAGFAEFIGPQLIKAGAVSELMKLVHATRVVKAAVRDLGEVSGTYSVKTRTTTPGQASGGGAPASQVSVHGMIAELQAKFPISEAEALFIRRVTEEKVGDDRIRESVLSHREDQIYLTGALKARVSEMIQARYDELGRFEELADPKYTDDGAIFDIMAVTVIDHHLGFGGLM